MKSVIIDTFKDQSYPLTEFRARTKTDLHSRPTEFSHPCRQPPAASRAETGALRSQLALYIRSCTYNCFQGDSTLSTLSTSHQLRNKIKLNSIKDVSTCRCGLVIGHVELVKRRDGLLFSYNIIIKAVSVQFCVDKQQSNKRKQIVAERQTRGERGQEKASRLLRKKKSASHYRLQQKDSCSDT